jgi:hypothetical protein
MSEAGGLAMCPADEYDDPALREEMTWHAIEQALADRLGEEHLPHLSGVIGALLEQDLPQRTPHVGPLCSPQAFSTPLGVLLVAATSDEHLAEAGFHPTVTLAATLHPA